MWGKDLVQLLLTQYEQHENLYNAENKGYKDKIKRAKSLNAICECMKQKNPNITVETIKTKIHVLRGQYIKENLKIEASKKHVGVNQDEIYVPKLWYYPLMGFLSSHTQSKPTSIRRYENQQLAFNCVYLPDDKKSSRKDDSTDEEVEEESNYFDETEASSPSIHSVAKSTFSNKRNLSPTPVEQIGGGKRFVSHALGELNDYDWLGQQVVFEMYNIRDERIRRDTAWKIQGILRESVLEDVALRVDHQRPSSSSYSMCHTDVKIE